MAPSWLLDENNLRCSLYKIWTVSCSSCPKLGEEIWVSYTLLTKWANENGFDLRGWPLILYGHVVRIEKTTTKNKQMKTVLHLALECWIRSAILGQGISFWPVLQVKFSTPLVINHDRSLRNYDGFRTLTVSYLSQSIMVTFIIMTCS